MCKNYSMFFLCRYFLVLLLLTSYASFTQQEKEIIYSEGDLRVLKIDNKQDSLVLRKKSKSIKKIEYNADLSVLIEKMKTSMKQSRGIGIAAPQIGINRNIFLFTRLDKTGNPVEVVINPKIKSYSKETICFERDGCLSIPNTTGTSKRHSEIEVEYKNEKGETIVEKLNGGSRFQDFTGVIFQHEYDHLKGILFIDKLCN